MSPNSPGGSPPDVGVIIPAAGMGERAGPGAPKQFRPIAGVPMLLRAVRPFARHPRVAQIVVALPDSVASAPPQWLASLAGERLRLVAGGATRFRSVAAALSALEAKCRIVLVHDAARPFVSGETIDRIIAAAEKGQGAVAAVPVYDTIKKSSPDGRIVETVDRTSLWRAQTPQGFPREMLETAYRKMEQGTGESDPSDDAQVAEKAGFSVVLVPDLTTNIKITTAEDFLLAEALASR